ncbi:unnamed protein product [Scytosiphon promiscuus]
MADVARKFDDVLRNLAGQAGSLETLLGVFFSFLHRNTDFYVTFDPATTAKAGMGFPTGKAEQLLLRSFRSFPGRSHGEDSPAPVPEAHSAEKTTCSSTASKASPPRRDPSEDFVAPSSSVAPSAAAAPNRGANPEMAGGIRVRYTEDGKQIPIGNGGVTPRYYWTQTVKEATVYVDVPPGTRSKDVSCTIKPRRLRLEVKGAGKAAAAAVTAAARAQGQAGVEAVPADGLNSDRCDDDGDLIFDGELPSTVSREDSMWSLSDGKTVVISFEKTTKSWWKSVVEGDPEIDTSQVDSTTKISEYDGETQGAIRKIMFDQRQKSVGLPTSDELNADALLERAKGLPGSPFLPGGVLSEGGGGAGAGDRLAPDGGNRGQSNP